MKKNIPFANPQERLPGVVGSGTGDLAADIAEGVVGVAAQSRDGGDAHHDNQGQHDGVFDCGWTVFVVEKPE
jgi:hypothetical protein